MKKFIVKISCIAFFIAGIVGLTLSGVHALDEETAAFVEEARTALAEVTDERTVLALLYLVDEYEVRQEATENSAVVQTIRSGQQVQIRDVFVDDDYQVWSYVTFNYGGQQLTGYIEREYLACSDQVFLEWEELYGMNPSKNVYAIDEDGQAVYADIATFPESYQEALTALKEAHPNWTFVKMDTDLDWDSVITAQMQGGRSLVPTSYPDYMKEGDYGAGWSYASENILKYYMDPRNSLQESTIFQFELLTYNETYHTMDAVQLFLDNTFMKGTGPGTVMSYAHIIWANGMDLGVSPFHLACRIYQEQGDGTSPLISGNYTGGDGTLTGLYNYFNVKASGTTKEEIYINGLTYAKNAMDVDDPTKPQPWNNAYYSIRGGANIIAANYILKDQDTLYLQKFNVVKNSSYGVHNHQYMQNIVAPTSEGKNIKKLYTTAGSLDNTFVFKIPVYNNMPETACAYPTESYDVILEAPEGYEDATIYLDGVAYAAQERNGSFVVTAPDANAKTAVMYEYNEKGVPVGMYCWELSYAKGAYSAKALTGLEDLLSYHGFSIRITGKSGIRCKTGISTETRAGLLGNGVDGYKLKEYGTLIMTNNNKELYPMVLGGTKVASGMAYGYDSRGELKDVVYGTVNGRYHYTAVLVGLPVEQYETEFAFRGYAVLTKDGEDVVIYGPIISKSIYALASQILAADVYEENSSAYQFLKQLVDDADALKPDTDVSGGDAADSDVSGGDAAVSDGNGENS